MLKVLRFTSCFPKVQFAAQKRHLNVEHCFWQESRGFNFTCTSDIIILLSRTNENHEATLYVEHAVAQFVETLPYKPEEVAGSIPNGVTRIFH
jgi:hypothetical protein